MAAPIVSVNSHPIAKHLNNLAKSAIEVPAVKSSRIAAGIIFRNSLISIGINRRKTHPFQAKYSKNQDAIFLHAETNAIINALRILSVDDLSKSSLIICRVKYEDFTKTNFITGLAKPCSGCMKAIIEFNINNVYYTLDDSGYDKL